VFLVNSQAGASAYQQVVSTVPVTVNPVFGSWDASKAQFADTSSLSEALS
jgi:hypothetical protein